MPSSLSKPLANSIHTEGSSTCSVRIYQRNRVSENEMEVTNTSVGVSDIDEGKKRQFAVQNRRTSVHVRRSLTLAQAIGHGTLGLSMDSLADDGDAVLGVERCASPVSYRECDGFCPTAESTARSASVVSLRRPACPLGRIC